MRTTGFASRPFLVALLAVASGLPAQAADRESEQPALEENERTTALARSVRRWARAVDSGRLRLSDVQPPDLSVSDIYRPVFVAGVLRRAVEKTHVDMLQALLFRAERAMTKKVRNAVLNVAALGYDRRAFDYQLVQARELAHWTLMRCDRPEVWEWLREVAARRARSDSREAARRVAALGLLGQRNDSTDRLLLESALGERDARIRLAAAEALGVMKRVESLEPLLGAFQGERHAVVAQAVVDAVHAVLRRHSGSLAPGSVDSCVEQLLASLPRNDWRTQLTIVHVARRFPMRAAVPALIDVLHRHRPAVLKGSVSARISPLLRHAAWEALCAMTGTRLPLDEPAAWRSFWAEEGDKVQLIGRGASLTAATRTTARATFYGHAHHRQKRGVLDRHIGEHVEGRGRP